MCVYCVVRTEYLYKIQVNLDVQRIDTKVVYHFHTPSPPSKFLQRQNKQQHSYKTRGCATGVDLFYTHSFHTILFVLWYQLITSVRHESETNGQRTKSNTSYLDIGSFCSYVSLCVSQCIMGNRIWSRGSQNLCWSTSEWNWTVSVYCLYFLYFNKRLNMERRADSGARRTVLPFSKSNGPCFIWFLNYLAF